MKFRLKKLSTYIQLHLLGGVRSWYDARKFWAVVCSAVTLQYSYPMH